MGRLPNQHEWLGKRRTVFPSSYCSFLTYLYVMARIRSTELLEAEELLEEVAAWSEDEIEQLPLLYREKAREYRRLVNSGER